MTKLLMHSTTGSFNEVTTYLHRGHLKMITRKMH